MDAKSALRKYTNPTSRFEAELRSIFHEPASGNHERDLRDSNHFLRGKALSDGNLRIIVLEVNKREQTTAAHTFEWEGNRTHDSIFLVASGGRLRWAKPSGRSKETSRKEGGGGGGMHWAEYRPYVEYGSNLRPVPTEKVPALTPRKHCSSVIKTHLVELTVGVGIHPWLEPEGKLVGSDDQCHSDQSTSSDVAGYEPTHERCAENWRDGVETLRETHRYLDEARKPYTPEQVERVAYAGAQLVRRAGGFVNAVVQIQELMMRSLHQSRETIDEYSYIYPAIADQAMEVFTKGVNPWVRSLETPTCEADTLPHHQTMTSLIIKTLRGDANEGFLFALHHEAIPKGELIPPSPTWGSGEKKSRQNYLRK